MKRLLLCSVVLPLLGAGHALAETKISTATTTPVKTSTAANGLPDNLLIEQAGSVKPVAAGVAVTLDAVRDVTNNGTIGFDELSDSTGVLLVGGAGGTFTNGGTISLLETYTAEDGDKDGDLDGPFAKGARRFGVRLTGPAAFTGDVRNSGSINVEGNDSAGISLESRLNGSLLSTGSVSVVGDRSKGLAATSIGGDARISGAVSAVGEGAIAIDLGQVDGAVVLQGTVSATGYRATDRLTDAARGKLDADDLKQGGGAVRITGSVGRGVLLDRPPADTDPNNADEDKDGVPDASEATASLTSFGVAPALAIGGAQATTIGAAGTGDLAFGLVNKGSIRGLGVNDGVAATAVRIGQAGGGPVTVQGGINNLGGTILAQAYGAGSTALLLEANANAPVLRNSGSITAEQTGGAHDAAAIVDRSGKLSLIETSGVIGAKVTAANGQTATGRAIAIDLSANTTGATVRQTAGTQATPSAITGDVLFGAGADRLELLSGSLTGALSFGAGDDAFVIDGGAKAAVALSDSDGRLSVDLRNGRLALGNATPVNLSSLALGAKGVLAIRIDPKDGAASRFNVSGAASFADGAQIEVTLTSLLRDPTSVQLVKAGSLSVGAAGASLAGAPYLYAANLRTDQAGHALMLDLRPKTASEIGLNRSGAAAYQSVFDVLDRNTAIEKAFLGQTTKEGFLGLYDQMLPDHSGASLMSAAAISSAVSSATAAPMTVGDNVDSGVWAQEIAFDIRRDRDVAAGFTSRGFGLAAGADAISGPHALGLALSFVSTDFKDRGAQAGEQVAMNVVSGAVYWRMRVGGLQAHARAGLGFAMFDSERRLAGPGVDLLAKADWNGWTADAHAGASYTAEAGRFYARPQVSIDYVRLSEGGYQEKGGGEGFDLKVAKRNGDLLTGEALLALGARFGETAYWAPELKVGYRQRLAGSPGRTLAQFSGKEAFALDPEAPFKHAVVARAGVRMGWGDLLLAIDGGGAFESSYREYDLRAVVRYQF